MMRVSFTLALATSFASSVSAKGMRGGSNPNPSMDSIYDDDMMKTMHGEEGSGMHDYGYDYGGEAEGSGMHYGNDEEKFKDYDLPGNEGHGSGMQHYTLDEDGKDHAAYGKKMLREPQICSDTEKCRDGLSCCMWENNLGSNAATGFCREMCKMGGKKERPKGDGMKDDKHKWNDDAMEHENDDEHKWKDDAMEHENDDEHKWKDEEEHKWKDEEEHKWKDAGVLPATPNRPVLAVRDTVPNTVPLPSKMNINQNNNKLRTQAPVAPKVLEALSASITLEGTTEQMLLESFAMQRSILQGYADATQIDASMIKISKIGRRTLIDVARRLQEKDSEDDAKSFASDAKNKATAAAHVVGSAVQKAANSSVWGNMHDGAKDAASATGGALKTGAAAASGAIADGTTSAANGIRSGYKAAANSSIWGDMHDGAKTAASATGSAAKTGAIAAGGAISSGATSAANSIKSLWDSATFEPLKVHFIITLGSGASLQDVERVQNQVQGATPSDVQRAILKKAMTEAPNFEVSEFQITAVSSAVAPGTQREDTVLGRIAAAGGVDKATVAGAVVGAFLVVIAIALFWCCCKKSKKTKEARAGQGPVSVGNLEKRLDVANHGHAMKL